MAGYKQSHKLSFQFRDGKQPLVSLKTPMNLLGLPLAASVSAATDVTDLGVHFASDFGFGPTFKVSYFPQEVVQNVLTIKAGLGPWLSPKNAIATVSAELDLKQDGDSRIWIKTKPVLGDFTLRRVQLPESVKPAASGATGLNGHSNGHTHVNGDSTVPAEIIEEETSPFNPFSSLGWGDRKPPTIGPVQGAGTWIVNIRSKLPVAWFAVTSFRWGMTVPKNLANSGVNYRDSVSEGIPTIFLEKITLRPAPRDGTKKKHKHAKVKDLATISTEVMGLRAENRHLHSSVEDLRKALSFGSGKGLAGNKKGGPADSKLSAFDNLIDGKAVNPVKDPNKLFGKLSELK